MERHTVLIVEDEPDTREYIAGAVGACAGLRVVGASGTVAEAIDMLRREAPDVLLVDLGLPDGSGTQVIKAARQLSADTQILVVTVFGDEKSVISAIEAGARGYLLKDSQPPDIARSVQDLLAGGSPISPSIARHLLRRFQEPESPGPDATAPTLTSREHEVLKLVVKGFTYAEIGDALGISWNTVSTHVRRIYRKLEVRSRSEAVFEALQLGIVNLKD